MPPELIAKFESIGMKVLHLSPLFKSKDWEGLAEILSSIDGNTKRDDFPLLIAALQEKRQRVHDFQLEIEQNLQELKCREKELQKLEYTLKVTQQRINDEVEFLQKYPSVIQTFLLNHLGIYNDKLVLSRRLDSLWQKSLKKKGILRYEPIEYIWYIEDLDDFVTDYLSRINRKTPFATEWDVNKEEKRTKNGYYATPSNPN